MSAASTRRTCIVTGADANMEALLDGLLQSLADTGIADRAHVAVLDFGLSEPMRDRMAGLCDEVIDPRSAAAPIIGFLEPRPLYTFYRIILPSLLPRHDTYVWLDADVWVQGPEMLEAYSGFTQSKDIVIAAETDPAYGIALWRHDWIVRRAEAMYGGKTARQLAIGQCLNAGVFAARATSPLWHVWLDHLRQCRNRSGGLLCDQMSLNYLTFWRQISAYVLPATYNWVCHAAAPKWLMSEGYWARPLFPHTKIEVMHLTSTSRSFATDITVGEESLTLDLSYDSALRLRDLRSRQRSSKTTSRAIDAEMCTTP